MVHDKWLSRQVWSKLLLIHHEFSQFFVAHSSDEVRDRRVGARSIADVLKNTLTVYKLRCTETPSWPYLQGSSNTFSKLGLSLHLHTLAGLSPALPHAATRTQWPVPQAFLRGMPNFSTSHVPSRGHHAPCGPRVTNISSSCNAPCTDTARC